MARDRLLRAWLALIGFSAASTATSLWQWPTALTALAGVLILGLAWAKARVILLSYLGLADAPFWRRGFSLCLFLYAGLLLALYLAPAVL